MHSEPEQSSASHGRRIALLLAAAATVRIGIALFALAVARPAPQFREPDSEGYLRLAADWLQTGRYATGAEPEILRSPGYPLLLIPAVASGHVDLLAIALQMVLSCGTVWLVYRTALAIFNNATTALAAAGLLACEPLSALYASKLLSETAFTTAISAAVYLLVGYMLSPGWRRMLAAAVCLALAAYLRPIAYYLPMWLGVSLLCIEWRRRGDHQRLLLQTLAFTCLGMALLLAWQFRNWKETGYGGFSAISDKNLYYYEALPILAEQRGISPAERAHARHAAGETDLAVYLRQHPEQVEWTAPRRYRFLRQDALRTIRAHPLAWAKVHFMGVLHTLTDSGRSAWLSFFGLADTRAVGPLAPPQSFWQRLARAASQRPATLAIHALLVAFVTGYLAMALVGALRAARLPTARLVMSAMFYLLVLSGGDAGYHRFRLPVVPSICLFAAHAYARRPRLQRRDG